MEIFGSEHLTSNKARELFELGKAWILKRWDAKSIEILPKTIGRNSGFIMDVASPSMYKPVRFFAKIQSAQIETVMIHHLLKHTQCGPVKFLVVLLTSEENGESNMHGVITEKESFDPVHSLWMNSDDECLFRTESLLFTIFISLGRFGNLPDNHDNWGISKFERKLRKRDAKTQSGLIIIDFSSLRSGTDKTLYSHDRFISAWKRNIYTMFHYSLSSYEIYNIEHLAKLVKRIDWLHSKQALLNLMQRVCTATDKWLANTVAECANRTGQPNNTSFARGASLPLTSFQKIAPPTFDMPCRGHYEMRSMLREYDRWLEMWNVQLERLFEWFPFPYKPTPVAPAAAAADITASLEPAQIVLPTEDGSAPFQDKIACAEEENVRGVAATQTARECTVGDSITQTDAQQIAQPQKNM